MKWVAPTEQIHLAVVYIHAPLVVHDTLVQQWENESKRRGHDSDVKQVAPKEQFQLVVVHSRLDPLLWSWAIHYS